MNLLCSLEWLRHIKSALAHQPGRAGRTAAGFEAFFPLSAARAELRVTGTCLSAPAVSSAAPFQPREGGVSMGALVANCEWQRSQSVSITHSLGFARGALPTQQLRSPSARDHKKQIWDQLKIQGPGSASHLSHLHECKLRNAWICSWSTTSFLP